MHSRRDFALFCALLFGVGCFLQLTNCEPCSNFNTEPTCTDVEGCMWRDTYCTCSSNVTMDVIFDLDSSGSIGASDYQIELEWTQEMIESTLPEDSRVGFVRFASSSVVWLTLEESESMTRQELIDEAGSIPYTAGGTNTAAGLDDSINMFQTQSDPAISKVLILITDGQPTTGDMNICSRSSTLKAMGVETIIIGVGKDWDPARVDCLVTSDDYIIEVDSYTSDQLDQILPTVTEVTCPVEYHLVITEVQVEPESDVKGSRFVEFYNKDSTVTLKDVELEGLFQGVITTDETVTMPQGSYLVLYDQDVADEPSCEDCLCTKDAGGTDPNWCVDAMYVPCCSSGCDCYFAGTGMDNENWNQVLVDSTSDEDIDRVEYDTSSWPKILQGYTYELEYFGYDNDQGANWKQSCNTRGTPGYEPIRNCSWTCTDAECQINGAGNADCKDNKCDCDDDDNYYFSGKTCTKIPPPGDCDALWEKNDTTGAQWVRFLWKRAETDSDHNYTLAYWTINSGSATDKVETTSRVKKVADYQKSRGTTEKAGMVRTKIGEATSTSVDCYPVTMSPSPAPTPQPTTLAPTKGPTKAPTWDSPRLYVGGDICAQDRCECNGDGWECTGVEITRNVAAGPEDQFLSVRKWPGDYPDLVMVNWKFQYLGSSGDDGTGDETRRRRLSDAEHNEEALRKIAGIKGELQTIKQWKSGRKLYSLMAGAPNATSTAAPVDTGGINPSSGVLKFDGSSEERIVYSVAPDEDVDDESRYHSYVLNLTECNTTQAHACFLVYPRFIYLTVDITGGEASSSKSSKEKEMPRWLWWVIGALILFLLLLAWLVYRYWWRNKRTAAELQETEEELDMAIREADLGFGHDLGAGDVAFNPMATGVPGTSKAPDLFAAEMQERQDAAQNERADVAVQPFKFQQEFGGNQGRKPQAGNDLGQPLLG